MAKHRAPALNEEKFNLIKTLLNSDVARKTICGISGYSLGTIYIVNDCNSYASYELKREEYRQKKAREREQNKQAQPGELEDWKPTQDSTPNQLKADKDELLIEVLNKMVDHLVTMDKKLDLLNLKN